MVVFFRQISCRVITVSYNVLFTMQFRQLISVIIQIPFCSAIRAFGNLIADILYAVVDPRVRVN